METVSSQLRDQETVAEMSMGKEERGKALEQEEQRTYNGPGWENLSSFPQKRG